MSDTRTTDGANLILQLVVAGAVVLWATGFVASVLWGIYWAIMQGHEPIEIIKSQYNWIGGAIFGYVAALVSFGFPGSIGTAKHNDTINKLADKAVPVTVPPEKITPGFEIPDNLDERK